MMLTWSFVSGVLLGSLVSFLLLWLTHGKRERRATWPACPHGCGFPQIHWHYGMDGRRYYYRGHIPGGRKR